ncbi:MAG: hypothetical protein IPH11_18680 [Ignavibacteriales bacterium]|nr:hypothetical protein [Ignavibacteriales bacterium]
MRKKKQKEGVKFAYEKVKQDVIEDCLPDGVRKFPDDFCTKINYDELKFEFHSTNGKRLHTDAFFNLYQMKTENGEVIFKLDSEVKAEFAELLSRQTAFQIKIPAEEKIVEQILKNYKNYISSLSDQLINNAKEKLHDWAIIRKMAKKFWKNGVWKIKGYNRLSIALSVFSHLFLIDQNIYFFLL